MGRALTIQRTVVTRADRARYLERARVRQEYYERASCRHWIFEERSLGGAFIEFTEGSSVEALAAAHASSPEPPIDVHRIYQEVELS